MNLIAPFEASGTASFPTHSFIMTDPKNDKLLKRYSIKVRPCLETNQSSCLIQCSPQTCFPFQDYPENLYIYDPYEVEGNPAQTEKNLAQLSKSDRAKYQKWKDTVLFNEVYQNFTGRSYLANYFRDPPRHFMVSGGDVANADR